MTSTIKWHAWTNPSGSPLQSARRLIVNHALKAYIFFLELMLQKSILIISSHFQVICSLCMNWNNSSYYNVFKFAEFFWVTFYFSAVIFSRYAIQVSFIISFSPIYIYRNMTNFAYLLFIMSFIKSYSSQNIKTFLFHQNIKAFLTELHC